MEQGAWRTLAAAHGETRGAWIVRETKPATLDVASADALAFPQRDPDALADASLESGAAQPRHARSFRGDGLRRRQ